MRGSMYETAKVRAEDGSSQIQYNPVECASPPMIRPVNEMLETSPCAQPIPPPILNRDQFHGQKFDSL